MIKELTMMPHNKVVTLDNYTCVYCGKELASDETTKEHVIGRRFVPKGTLNSAWNLIVNACLACNNAKSDFENDISAITMQPDAWGRHPNDETVLADEALRKGKNSISRRTKKAVKDSFEEIEIKVPQIPGIDFTFNFTSPPIVENHRLFELARLQLMGFFYLITYSNETRRGGFWLGEFCPLQDALRSDWGNPVQISFMNLVHNWEPRFLGIGADGYFKVVIRRHPSAVCWSWGLEWNQKMRVIGFMGERETIEDLLTDLPSLDMMTVPQNSSQFTRFRIEKELTDEEDKLFQYSEI